MSDFNPETDLAQFNPATDLSVAPTGSEFNPAADLDQNIGGVRQSEHQGAYREAMDRLSANPNDDSAKDALRLQKSAGLIPDEDPSDIHTSEASQFNPKASVYTEPKPKLLTQPDNLSAYSEKIKPMVAQRARTDAEQLLSADAKADISLTPEYRKSLIEIAQGDTTPTDELKSFGKGISEATPGGVWDKVKGAASTVGHAIENVAVNTMMPQVNRGVIGDKGVLANVTGSLYGGFTGMAPVANDLATGAVDLVDQTAGREDAKSIRLQRLLEAQTFHHDVAMSKKQLFPGVNEAAPESQVADFVGAALVPGVGAEEAIAKPAFKLASKVIEKTPKAVATGLKVGAAAAPAVGSYELYEHGHPFHALEALVVGYGGIGLLGRVKGAVLDKAFGGMSDLTKALATAPDGVTIVKQAQKTLDKQIAVQKALEADARAANVGKFGNVDKTIEGAPYPTKNLTGADKTIRGFQDTAAMLQRRRDSLDWAGKLNRVLSDGAKIGLTTSMLAPVTGATIAGIGASGAQPSQVEEASKEGMETGTAIGLVTGPMMAHRGDMKGRVDALVSLGEKHIDPTDPDYAVAQKNMASLTPEARDEVNKYAGFNSPNDVKYIPLTKEEYAQRFGVDAAQNSPNGHYDPQTNRTYLVMDGKGGIARGALGHESSHPLEQSIGAGAVKNLIGEGAKGSPEEVKQFVDNYDGAMRKTYPAYAGLSPEKQKSEMFAELGRDILNGMPPETFYGGKGGWKIITDKLKSLMGSKEPSGLVGTLGKWQAPEFGGTRTGLEGIFYDLGEAAKLGLEIPKENSIEGSSKRSDKPSAVSTFPENKNADNQAPGANNSVQMNVSDAEKALQSPLGGKMGKKEAKAKIEEALAAAQEQGVDPTAENLFKYAKGGKFTDVHATVNPADSMNIPAPLSSLEIQRAIESGEIKNETDFGEFTKGKDVQFMPAEKQVFTADQLKTKEESDGWTVEAPNGMTTFVSKVSAKTEARAKDFMLSNYLPHIKPVQFMPSTHPDAIKDVAVKFDDGTVDTGKYHAYIRDRKSLDGVDGYVTNAGEFLNREEAMKRAIELNQVPDFVKSDKNLEARTFDEFRSFMPSTSDPIQSPAVKVDDMIFKGESFLEAKRAAQEWGADPNKAVQGWTTKKGQFLTEQEARSYGEETGQLPEKQTDKLSPQDFEMERQFMPGQELAKKEDDIPIASRIAPERYYAEQTQFGPKIIDRLTGEKHFPDEDMSVQDSVDLMNEDNQPLPKNWPDVSKEEIDAITNPPPQKINEFKMAQSKKWLANSEDIRGQIESLTQRIDHSKKIPEGYKAITYGVGSDLVAKTEDIPKIEALREDQMKALKIYQRLAKESGEPNPPLLYNKTIDADFMPYSSHTTDRQSSIKTMKDEVLKGINANVPDRLKNVTDQYGLIYNGIQGDKSGEPKLHLFTDTKTKSTFSVPIEGTSAQVQERLNQVRARFDVKFMPGDKNLVAVHNLSEDNLRHADRMGGLALPSIAITRADKVSFGNFGDISLVGSPDLIKPSRDMKVSNADAYSARYPTVKYFLDSKSQDSFRDLIGSAIDKVPKADKSFSRWSTGSEIEDRGFTKGLENDAGAQLAYLVETGQKVPKMTGDQSKDFYSVRKIFYNEGKMSKYKDWLEQKANDFTVNEKIFQGFTNAGNRRYLNHDLDTVVRIMKKEFKEGEGFNYGAGSVRSKAAKQFKTIKEIQDSRDDIVSPETMEKLKEEANNELTSLADEVMPLRENNVEGFGRYDAFSSDLQDMATGGQENWKYLREQYGENSEAFPKMRDFLEKLRNMPSEYFEAKSKRKVDLHEFTGAVVPEGTKESVVSMLEKRGLNVETYKKGDPESRRQTVESMARREDVLFMPSTDPDAIATDKPHAVRMPDGKVFRDSWHAGAYVKAVTDPSYSAEQIGKWIKEKGDNYAERGSVTNKGDFLPYGEDLDRAIEKGQVTKEDLEKRER